MKLFGASLFALLALGSAGCNDTVAANSGGSGGAGGGEGGMSMMGTGGEGGAPGTGGSGGTGGTGGGGAVDRGPKLIPLSISPNGIFWDAPTKTLLIADDDGNRVLTWTDAKGFGKPIALAAAPPEGPGLGAVIKTKDGTVLVARFGFGTAGDIAFVKSDGTTGTVPNLDKTKRRIGLTESDDGRIFDTYFEAVPGGYSGAIAEVKLTGSETDVVTPLAKPVGVLAVGKNLIWDDQTKGEIDQAPLSDPTKITVFATIDSPDLLSNGPDGSIFTGGGAEARQVFPNGTQKSVGTGFQGVRGVSYDAANKRLFIADHDAMQIGIQPID